MQKIENKQILNQLRDENKKRIANSKCRVLICAGTGCLAGGSGEIYKKISEIQNQQEQPYGCSCINFVVLSVFCFKFVAYAPNCAKLPFV